MKEDEKMRKEAKAFTIGLFGIFLNFPIVLILYFFAPNMMEKIFSILAPLELIVMGLLTIKMAHDYDKTDLKGYEACEGIIKGFEFVYYNGTWLKAPVVLYTVNNKEYLSPVGIGINGILNSLLKGKKIKIYFNKNNPEIIRVKNYIFTILGVMFIIVGIILLCLFL